MGQRSAGAAKGASGRPRDRQIDQSVIETTLAILDAEGYAGVSFEAVARRAGTSRPAVYRRWSTRAALVLAAVGERLDIPDPPDTGCTLCDIGESFDLFLASYRTIRPESLSALYAECATDPDLRASYLETIIEPTRTAVGIAVDRAIARGDLRPDSNREVLLDLVGSLVHYRSMFSPDHLSDDDAWSAVETLLRGAARDYPALLAHSEELERQHLDASHGQHHHPH
ncbi:TetR family transcriptional regulator [Aeromicrobium sp. PE09-221]|uniref:TetR/AcrR family transcriptional regulator n=1 Tax=Aeromicrobium sp. PE09-221 TaxID=1898043 RepID=UPI000B3EC3B4|nr:TetR/AcrR family transcriptional regulator [Aeromicrobium sp. PE09-221]OUZ12191.1 TetR family transcriptional regulator [Aeromicrobium sp. PE09-221]